MATLAELGYATGSALDSSDRQNTTSTKAQRFSTSIFSAKLLAIRVSIAERVLGRVG